MPTQVGGHRQQAGGRQQGDAAHQGGFRGVGRGEDQGAPAAGGLSGKGQGAVHRTQLAGEGELPGKFVACQALGRDLAGCGEDAEGDGQIKAATFLGQIGGGQIDRDASLGKFKQGGLQRGAHPIAGFAHLDIRQTHQREGREPVGEMNLHLDFRGEETDEGAACQGGQTHDLSGMGKSRV